MTEHLLNSHCRLVTDDPQESQDVIGRMWERHRVILREPHFAVRWHQADLKRSSLAYVDHPCSVYAACDGPLADTFRVLLPFEGRLESRINGKPGLATPAMATIHAPGQDLKLEIAPFRLLLLSLDGDFVRAALLRRFGRVRAFETWATQFPMAEPAASTLHSLTRWAAAELDRETSALLTKPRVVAAFERCLLSLFLNVLEDRCAIERKAREDISEAHVRHIEAWIEANLTEPIGIEEIAGQAGVSSRSVQTAFRRVRGCTPMQYVQQRRLELARQVLQAPTPTTTVTNAAVDCGLFHFGRFAAAYRALFGEKPSDTLARSRRGAAA